MESADSAPADTDSAGIVSASAMPDVRAAAAEHLGLALPKVVVTIADLAHRRPPPVAQTQERS
ncbi:hypothetical protein [Tomitella gaofuii]|uniref:hypothetical protein n=1 Tax=Tomitella gaofuii TaxID=2760083 RepID=UPI0015FAB576|nr:hypothetical protein [Tomitella gaofuii]